jgi:hypothetical protein
LFSVKNALQATFRSMTKTTGENFPALLSCYIVLIYPGHVGKGLIYAAYGKITVDNSYGITSVVKQVFIFIITSLNSTFTFL